MNIDKPIPADRRAFLQAGSLILLPTPSLFLRPAPDDHRPDPVIQMGLVTDLHYADKPPAGSRYYRQTLRKIQQAAEQFGDLDLDGLMELGDLIDSADSIADERAHLKTIDAQLKAICAERHYVLGNHCVHNLTKPEFLDEVGQQKSYYAFQSAGFNFIVLDACFRQDGVAYERQNFQWTDTAIPEPEVEWLRSVLETHSEPTIVFCHQRLDVANHYGVKNASQVRELLEKHGQVLAVFQGHSHDNDHKSINNIHYVTLVAMVEGAGPERNGFSVLKLFPDQSLEVTGWEQQHSYQWSRASR